MKLITQITTRTQLVPKCNTTLYKNFTKACTSFIRKSESFSKMKGTSINFDSSENLLPSQILILSVNVHVTSQHLTNFEYHCPQDLSLSIFLFFPIRPDTSAIGSRHKRQVRVLISLERIARPVSTRTVDLLLLILLLLLLLVTPFIRHRVVRSSCSYFSLSLSLDSPIEQCAHRPLRSRIHRNLRFWIMLPSRWSNDRSIGSGLPSPPVSSLRLASTYRCHFQSYESTILFSFPLSFVFFVSSKPSFAKFREPRASRDS